MKCTALLTVSLALFSAASVLAQSSYSQGSTGNSLVRPAETKPQEVSSPAVNGAPSGGSSGTAASAGQSDEDDSVPFTITKPNGGTFKKGETITIEWINGIDENFKIKLLAGSDPKAMQPTKVKFFARGLDGKYEWTIPETLSDGTYAINFVFANNAGGKTVEQESYSEQFKIVSGKATTA